MTATSKTARGFAFCKDRPKPESEREFQRNLAIFVDIDFYPSGIPHLATVVEAGEQPARRYSFAPVATNPFKVLTI